MTNIKSLVSGFDTFRKTYFETNPDLFHTLSTDGQKPHTLVIACSDSRIDPALIFGAEPGDLFVVRNVANLVPEYAPDQVPNSASTAIEYAVRDLGVSNILILGHAQCGGIGAACSHAAGGDLSARDFLESWVETAANAIIAEFGAVSDDVTGRKAEQASLKKSMQNLSTFPWVAERVANGSLDLHGWWFDLEGGKLWGLDDTGADFIQISGA